MTGDDADRPTERVGRWDLLAGHSGPGGWYPDSTAGKAAIVIFVIGCGVTLTVVVLTKLL